MNDFAAAHAPVSRSTYVRVMRHSPAHSRILVIFLRGPLAYSSHLFVLPAQTMHWPAFSSFFVVSTFVVGTGGFVPPSQRRLRSTSIPPPRAQSRETAVKDEVDLCTINESFCEVTEDDLADSTQSIGFSYAQFAKDYPFANNIGMLR